MSDEIFCVGFANGTTIIGFSDEANSEMDCAFFIKTVTHPESGERFFSFEPVLPYARRQNIPYNIFKKIKDQAVGLYRPVDTVKAAYREFIENDDRVAWVLNRKATECPPDKKWVEEVLGQECPGDRPVTRDGKLIEGAFTPTTKIGDE